MAPSPELGHPKAPDKIASYENDGVNESTSNNKNNVCSSETSSQCISKNSSIVSDTASATVNSTLNSTVSSSSTTVNTSLSTLAEKNTSKKLRHLDDSALKELLDEAYSYKNPKDRENKSEMFLQLLKKVEREKDDSFSFRSITSRFSRTSSNNQHGGSLQDLFEAAHNDLLLDTDYIYGNRNRRHHNSRPKKYSLVSSRQREGGSLPSNVNASNCNISVYDQPFLTEVNKKRGKNERSSGAGMSCINTHLPNSTSVSLIGQDSVPLSSIKNDPNNTENLHTVIDIDIFPEEKRYLLSHDSLAQGISETIDEREKNELQTAKKHPRSIMNVGNRNKSELSITEPKQFVDDTISFTSLERGKNVDATCVPFDETYKSCKSVLGERGDFAKSPTILFPTSKVITKQFDENGNSVSLPYTSGTLQPKMKKKKSQSERNTTTLNIKSVAGYRGEDTVENLLKFIESSESKKNDKNYTATNKKKEKKRDKDREKDVKKGMQVKKSNSLEELRSCTQLDMELKIENSVTMRKTKKTINPAVNDSVKESFKNQSNHKRSERRSWGEELTYLKENRALEEVREKSKEKERPKKSKEIAFIDKLEKSEHKKKKEDTLPICNDLTVNEIAEFHVVTKKKKMKRRKILEENQTYKKNDFNNKEITNPINRKYEKTCIFTNDRDLYLKSLNSTEPRRKSTSSVPPSEKSDASDLDSVHSLPIEPTINRIHILSSSNTCQVQPQSYADIAKIVNPDQIQTIPSIIDTLDKWPTVTSVSSSLVTKDNSLASSLPLSMSDISKDFANTSNSKRNFISHTKYKSSNQNYGDCNVSQEKVNDTNVNNSSAIGKSTIIGSEGNISYKSNERENDIELDLYVKLNTSVKIISQPLATTKKLSLEKDCVLITEHDLYNVDHYPALEKTVKKHPAISNTAVSNINSSTKQSNADISTLSYYMASQSNQNFNLSTADDDDIKLVTLTENNALVCKESLCSSDNSLQWQLHGKELPCNSDITDANIATNTNIKNDNLNMKKKLKIATKNCDVSSSSSLAFVDSKNAKNKISAPIDLSDSHDNSIQYVPAICNVAKNPCQEDIGNDVATSDRILSTCKNTSKTTLLHSNKCLNRPAVIMLNDLSYDNAAAADFTFGDFKENELLLFGEYSKPDYYKDLNINVEKASMDSTLISDIAEDIVLLSPNSDHGYSSNNVSTLSEYIDENSKQCNMKKSNLNNAESKLKVSSMLVQPKYQSIIISQLGDQQLVANNSECNPLSVGSQSQTLKNNNLNFEICDVNSDDSTIKPTIYSDAISSRPTEKNESSLQYSEGCCKQSVEQKLGNSTLLPTSKTSAPDLMSATAEDEWLPEDDCGWNGHNFITMKEIKICFVAPPSSHELNSSNFEKIVDFVELAWEDVLHEVDTETQYYKGQ